MIHSFLFRWIYNNVKARWGQIRKRQDKLEKMFSGYQADKYLVSFINDQFLSLLLLFYFLVYVSFLLLCRFLLFVIIALDSCSFNKCRNCVSARTERNFLCYERNRIKRVFIFISFALQKFFLLNFYIPIVKKSKTHLC